MQSVKLARSKGFQGKFPYRIFRNKAEQGTGSSAVLEEVLATQGTHVGEQPQGEIATDQLKVLPGEMTPPNI